MKSYRSALLILCLAFTLCLGSNMAFAKGQCGASPKGHQCAQCEQCAQCAHGKGQHFPSARMIEKLSLTPDQVSQLEAWHKSHHDEWTKRHDLVAKQWKKLNKAMKRNTSEAKLRELHNELESARASMNAFKFDKALAVRRVLTPKQRKTFKGLKMSKWHTCGQQSTSCQ